MGSLDRLLELECMRIGEALFPHLNELTRDEEQEYNSLKSEIEKNQEIVDRLKEINIDKILQCLCFTDIYQEPIKIVRDAKLLIELQKILDGGEK